MFSVKKKRLINDLKMFSPYLFFIFFDYTLENKIPSGIKNYIMVNTEDNLKNLTPVSQEQKQGNGNNRRKNYNRKHYRKPSNANNSNVKKESEQKPLPPKIKPRTYTPKKKRIDTFTEVHYSDKVVFVLGVSTLVMSLFMWFMGYREESIYLGIWVPGIFSSGTFIRQAFSRAKRK